MLSAMETAEAIASIAGVGDGSADVHCAAARAWASAAAVARAIEKTPGAAPLPGVAARGVR